MSVPSIIFWIVIVVPFIALLFWVMKQDKRKGFKGAIGMLVLAVTFIVAIIYMFIMTKGR